MRVARVLLFFGSLLLGACAATELASTFHTMKEDSWYREYVKDWQEKVKHDPVSTALLAGRMPAKVREASIIYTKFIELLTELESGGVGGLGTTDASRFSRFLKVLKVARWSQGLTKDGSESLYCYDDQDPYDDTEREYWAIPSEMASLTCDDCDGFASLMYHALRFVGFSEDEVFLAALHERGTASHHMVVFWFDEGLRNEPYVLDPTEGVITPVMKRSYIPDWVTDFMFNEVYDYEDSRTKTHGRGP